MPCGICKTNGHNKNTCPHKDIRGKVVYQIVCGILANYSSTWGQRHDSNNRSVYASGSMYTYANFIFKNMSIDALRDLCAYIESHFRALYQDVYTAMIHCDEFAQYNYSDTLRLRKAQQYSLGCMYHSVSREIVFAGLPTRDVDHILNTPEIINNTYLQRRIWKSPGSTFVINTWITRMTFRRMIHAIEPVMRKEKLKLHLDESITVPSDCPDCPICMEPFNINTIAKLDCGHFVCAPCMQHCDSMSYTKAISCCLCRQPVTKLTCALVL